MNRTDSNANSPAGKRTNLTPAALALALALGAFGGALLGDDSPPPSPTQTETVHYAVVGYMGGV